MKLINQIPFLSTFDQNDGSNVQQGQPQAQQLGAPAPQVIVVPQAQPAPAPPQQTNQGTNGESVIPASAMPAILQAVAQREAQAAQAVQQARAQHQQVVNPAPAPNPIDTPPQPQGGQVTNKQLQGQINDLTQALHKERMEGYRQSRINQLRQQGIELIDGIVMGNDKETIEASLQVAQAEYAHTAARVAQQIQAQAQQAVVNGQPQGPQGYVGQVGGQPVAPPQPQAPHQQPMGQPISAPSYVAAPGVPEAPQQEFMQAIQQITSSAGIRNGQYAIFRDQIMASLRGAAQGPGGNKWTFQPQGPPQLAPPVPQSVPAPGFQQQAYAGPPQPTAHPATSGAFGNRHPVHPPAPAMSPPGIPQAAFPQPHQNPHAMAASGYAAQPAEIEAGVPLDPAAARAKAVAAVAANRPRAATLPSIH